MTCRGLPFAPLVYILVFSSSHQTFNSGAKGCCLGVNFAFWYFFLLECHVPVDR